MESELMRDVRLLAEELGERHDGGVVPYAHLCAAADHIDGALAAAGWSMHREPFTGAKNRTVENVVAQRRGNRAPHEIIIVGAHYDSVRGGPGADDNATGVAAILAIARALGPTERTVRIVAFTNEERPHTRRRTMGSLVHAKGCRSRCERIIAMLSLECLGFHVGPADARRDLGLVQRLLPVWTSGVFVVGNLHSRTLVDRVAGSMQEAPLPIRRVAAPGFLPLAKSSDHWAFWKNGYPAVMITDAAPLRYRHYHRATDTADHLNAGALAATTRGVLGALTSLGTSRVSGHTYQ